MTALLGTLGALLAVGVPFYMVGVMVGRRLERRDHRRRIARSHGGSRPRRAPARDVIRAARQVIGDRPRHPDHPLESLAWKPAFGDEPAGGTDVIYLGPTERGEGA